ncbi:MAG: multi-sensor hybrid histidine kinase, partial [Armatimonadetes bacterium]|nr:multi-sensor hybrid histidine kinase [Armatimonadota bacterium]
MQFRKLPRPLQLYIVAQILLVAPALWLVLQQPLPRDWFVVSGLLIATALAGSWKLELTVFQARMSIVFAVACLALLLEGPTAAVSCAALGAVVTTLLRSPQGKWKLEVQRQPFHRLLFNPAHCALVCALAALAYTAALPWAPAEWAGPACGLILFTSVYFLANSYGIAVAIGMQQQLPAPRVWKENFLWTAPGFYASALAALAIWGAIGVLGAWALVLVAPLYLIYYSGRLYLRRLEQTNASLTEQITERERAEAALRQEREFLHAVLENAADGIVACDASGRLTHVNWVARTLVGAREGEQLDAVSRHSALVPPLRKALGGEALWDHETAVWTQAGDKRQLMMSGQPIQAENGEPTGAVLVIHDVTEQRHALRSRERLIREQAARNAAEEGQQRIAFLAEASEILASSLDYETTLGNVARLCVPFLAQACLIDVVEDTGLRRLAAVRAEGDAPLQDRGRYGLAGLPLSHPVRIALDTGSVQAGRGLGDLRTDDETFEGTDDSFICCPLVVRGETLGVISFLADSLSLGFSTEDVALARDLARRAAQAMDNARLFREVQEHDRRKDVFLAMLGHELRNPLAAMANSLEVIRLRGSWDGPNAQALNVLLRQTKHQARLIDDLLDVSRITQGKIQLRTDRVDLARVAHQAVESARPFIESRAHVLELEISEQPIWLEADPTRLEQVLVNLLNNAAKYTDVGGRIRISLEVSRTAPGAGLAAGMEPGPTAVVRVRDNGIGMSPELARRVFDVFTQAEDARERAQGGLGLGLSLVRGLTELHGGRVEALSTGLGEGSEFVLYFPMLSAPVELSLPPAPPTTSRPTELRVLIVDDNRDAGEMTAEVLELWGFAPAEVVHSG